MTRLFLALITASTLLFSTQTEAKSNVLAQDILLELSQEKTWLQLLHVEQGGTKNKSLINNNSFFISPNGKNSSIDELSATYEAFFTTPKNQCKFPARKMWLERVLPNVNFPKINCPNYKSYKKEFNTSSVSIVYASGYLGNPASMYGHVLLKLNNKEGAELLDNTFSYGAMVPETDNKFAYIYKGITGGYQGQFANQKYHHQHLLYSESELRDLWEYRLKLTSHQIEFLLAHLWELEQSTMTYFFFEENCGYQLAKLIELIIDTPLIAPMKAWVMPYDLIMMLNKLANRHIVEQVIYHQSRQEMLYEKYNQLSKQERSAVRAIIEGNSDDVMPTLSNIAEKSAKRIIDTLYDYYAFIDVKNDELTEQQIKKRDRLLTKRFSLPAGATNWNRTSKLPPHYAQNTAMAQIGFIHNDSFGHGKSLRFRANYYDFLNINAARIPFSELNTFDLRLLYQSNKNRWLIREFSLFNITNLNVSQTGLEGDQFYAWSLNAGYKPTSLKCSDCSDAFIGGFIGQSKQVFSDSAIYAAIASEIQFSDLSKGNFLIGPEFGGVLNITQHWVSSIKIGTAFNLTEEARSKNYIKWEQRFFESQDFDIRTHVLYDEVFEYALNFSIYW